MKWRSACLFAVLLFVNPAISGINWKAVWLEPRMPVILRVGESQPFKVMGLNGANSTADLTHSQYLKLETADATIVKLDKQNATLTGEKPGRTELRISFSEATAIVQVLVRGQSE